MRRHNITNNEKKKNLLQISYHYFNVSHENCGSWCGKKSDPSYVPNNLPNGKWLNDVIISQTLVDGTVMT